MCHEFPVSSCLDVTELRVVFLSSLGKYKEDSSSTETLAGDMRIRYLVLLVFINRAGHRLSKSVKLLSLPENVNLTK